MTKRIFRSSLIVGVSVFVASVALIMGVLYHYFSDITRSQLNMQTTLAARGVENAGADFFAGMDLKDYRVTWIDTDGSVLYDSVSEPEKMENHAEREEIKQAFTKGTGESSRYSSTMMERFFYCAERLSDGTVLRLSIAQSTQLSLLMGMFQPICIVAGVAIVLSFILASRLSKKVVKPLNELNLEDPLNNEGFDELSPLFRRLKSQQRQIRSQSEELQKRQAEFETVTENMTEGIVLLNSKGTVLSINHAAARLLGAENTSVGQDILEINRSLKMQELLRESGKGKHAEKIMELGGRRYQVHASPVVSEGEVPGTVLLMLDVTEKEQAEQIRREFTANVSHELKTPLHTISGCAELLANGMVKPEDIPTFSTQIYTEAQRMICLVEDIIKLSHLDEGADAMKWEEVDLYQMAENVTESLSAESENAGVRIMLEGESTKLNGIPQLLQSIIYNLCDNAIKYNHKGGTVIVTVKQQEQTALLCVQDTGIGIPAEGQNRIFERFYRIDKSHSKEIGGTGLGLSIVKHAVKLHNAVLELDSVVGKGTTVTVKFALSDSDTASE